MQKVPNTSTVEVETKDVSEVKEVSSESEDAIAATQDTKEHAVLVEEFMAESHDVLGNTESTAVQETETGADDVGISIVEDALESKDEHVTEVRP